MENKVLSIENLTFAYEKSIPILSSISFEINENENIAIIGANGVGKSTLLKAIVGLILNFTGIIKVYGTEVSKANLAKIREKLGYVFQDSDSQLFLATVYDDVAFGPRNYGYSNEEVDKRTKTALEMVGIGHLIDKEIYKMSGGEKKLASIRSEERRVGKEC